MISNACMSPNCAYYLQPLKPAEFNDHMRLWRRTLPARFHFTVATLLKQKKTIEEIYSILIKSNEINLHRHKKTEEEVLKYIALIKDSLV